MRPLTGAAVVGLAFPVAVLGGLDGPTGAAVLGFFAAPGWAGYRVARASWRAPLALHLLAGAGTWVAGRAAGSTVTGLGAQAWENLFFGLLAWGAWGVGLVAGRLRDRGSCWPGSTPRWTPSGRPARTPRSSRSAAASPATCTTPSPTRSA